MNPHRIALILWLATGGVGIFAVVRDHLQAAEDREFHAKHVVPYLDELKRQDTVSSAAQPTRTRIGVGDPLEEWIRRMRRRADDAQLEVYSLISLFVITFGWIGLTITQREWYERKRRAPERPADPGAGGHLAELERIGGTLAARWSGGGWQFPHYSGNEVVVDVRKRIVTFRGFTFLTSLVGNRRTVQTEVPFSELLGGRIAVHHGRATLQLRTTKGRVYLSDSLRPFEPLAVLLLDAIEVNRLSPETYRAALAREPLAHTPWYVWLSIGVAGGTAFGVVWWAVS